MHEGISTTPLFPQYYPKSAILVSSITPPTTLILSPQNYPKKLPENMKRLSDREFQEKRSKGLCFPCDEKWNIGHKCKNGELSVMLIMGEEELLEDEVGEEETEQADIPVVPVSVSFNSVIGIDNPKTMRLTGTINGDSVIVMIDPGATHNFISLAVVEKLGLVVSLTPKSLGLCWVLARVWWGGVNVRMLR